MTIPRDLIAEKRLEWTRNDERIVALVRDNPGMCGVDAAGLRLLVAPGTVRRAAESGVVELPDHRLHPRAV